MKLEVFSCRDLNSVQKTEMAITSKEGREGRKEGRKERKKVRKKETNKQTKKERKKGPPERRFSVWYETHFV